MEDILELSKEQLEEMFIITNIKTIEKEKLTKDDINNNKDMVIISKVTENVYIKDGKKQSTLENTADIMTYLIMTMFAGHGLSKIEQLIFHDEIKNKLKNIEYKFIPLNECDLNNLKIIIDMKEQNLELLRDSSLPKVRTRSKR